MLLSKKCGFFLLLSLTSCIIASAADNPCLTQNGSMETAQCMAEKLKSVEAQLDSSFQEALETRPDAGDLVDIRKTKAQLKKAQNAWRVYRNENCSYVGGLQGGSDIWVTIFSTECALHETERRIEFFKNLPTSG